VSIYGSIDLTRDKVGLASALQLKEIIDLTVAALKKTDPPAEIVVAPTDTVDNPYKVEYQLKTIFIDYLPTDNPLLIRTSRKKTIVNPLK
jgi:hypothetical protein